MSKSLRPTPPSPKEWADVCEAILDKWLAAYEPPLWVREVVQVDSPRMAVDEFDGGRLLAQRGVGATLGEAMMDALNSVNAILLDRVDAKLRGEAKAPRGIHRAALEEFLGQVSFDVCFGVLGEVSLRQIDVAAPWIPGYSRALDAWGAGFGLGGGIDESGEWPVAALGIEREIMCGPVGFSGRHTFAEELIQKTDGWVRATIVASGEMTAKEFDVELEAKRIAARNRERSRRERQPRS